MGWLKPKSSALLERPYDSSLSDINHKVADKDSQFFSVEHVERIVDPPTATTATTKESYPFQPTHLPDPDLPFIPSTVVLQAKRNLHRIWIVINNVVFDATDFLHEHPGGNTVIESFAGQDCSWQFWRFHNRRHMRDSGLGLRIGRTAGVGNRFAERPRFVGLRKLDEWGY
jgi:cytochrome b involved in lipid metabolism